MRSLPDDPYQWWNGKRVDVRGESKQWALGEVIEARRSTIVDVSSEAVERKAYEADYGEPDGYLRVILLDGQDRGKQLGFDIWPSGHLGYVPNVTPHIDHGRDVAVWWRELSASTKAALLLNPTGPVPSEAVVEIARSGALITGTYWPGVQDGPEGFMLPDSYRRLIEDLKLLRDYGRAEDALTKSRSSAERIAIEPISDPEVVRRFEEAVRAKQLLDDFRFAEMN